MDPAEELNKKTLDKVESILKVKNPRLITVSRFDKRKNHEKNSNGYKEFKTNLS